MKRRLTLTSEHLTDLTPADLASVAGGAQTDGCIALTQTACGHLSFPCLTGHYPTINDPCTSN